MVHEFCAAGVVFVVVHHLAQLCFHLGKGFPPVLCPLPEALPELRQRNTLFAPVDKLFGVLVTRSSFQCLFKVTQGGAFLIQKIISGSDPIIPAVIFGKMLLMGSQKFQRLFKRLPFSYMCNGNICLGQLTVQFRGALLGRNRFQGVDYLLRFILFKPLLALFQ